MRTVTTLLLTLCGFAFSAMAPCTVPIASIDTANPPKVIYVDQNVGALKNCDNEDRDTLNNVVAAFGGSTAGSTVGLASVGNLKMTVDRDSNTTGARFWIANHTNDSLFRVRDDSTARFFGSIFTGGGTYEKTTTLTSNTTLTRAHSVIFASAAGGSFTIIPPQASQNTGLIYTIFKTDLTTNTVTINPLISEIIDNQLTLVLGGNRGASRVVIISDGTSWKVRELYEEGSFTAALTGCTTSPTGTATYFRDGKKVTLILPGLTGTSNANTLTYTGLPAFLAPSAFGNLDRWLPYSLYDFGALLVDAKVYLNPAPLIEFWKGGSSSIWQTSGAKGLAGPITLTYEIL
ncbi:MAG: hypothetical protein ABIY63_13360 [Fibrobacteria bacterium]